MREGRPQILVVDDDPDILEALSEILEAEGYEVDRARHGQEALARIDQRRPDLILLDLMMPVMDGWEFLRLQQRDPKIARVPVIILSALDQARIGDVGAAAALKKPLDFDRLLDLVRGHCNRSN